MPDLCVKACNGCIRGVLYEIREMIVLANIAKIKRSRIKDSLQ